MVRKKQTFMMLLILLLFCICSAHAQPSSHSFPIKLRAVMAVVWNNALTISIFFVFLSALVGFFAKTRAVDKCLKHFLGFWVCIEQNTGQLIQGTMRLYSTGIEMEFSQPQHDKELQLDRYSQILYKNEFSNIQLIYRYQDQLTEENQKKREKDIRRSYKPGIYKKFCRSFRNVLGSFRDAFSQSLSILLGQVKKIGPGATILKGQEKRLTTIGSEIIGYAGNTYDPILENHIGRKVVVEISQGEKKQQYCGIFKEYSPEFLEILNIAVHQVLKYDMEGAKTNSVEANEIPLTVSRNNNRLLVRNEGGIPIFVNSIQIDNRTIEVAELLQPKSEKEIMDQAGEDAIGYGLPCIILLHIIRQADMIAPRSHAVFRYAGGNEKADWKKLVRMDVDFLPKI